MSPEQMLEHANNRIRTMGLTPSVLGYIEHGEDGKEVRVYTASREYASRNEYAAPIAFINAIRQSDDNDWRVYLNNRQI